MKTLFKDKLLDEQFREDGFVVIPFITTEQLNALKESFSKHYDGQYFLDSDFFCSLLANDGISSMSLKKELEKILKESYEKTFEPYRSVTESFLAKPHTEEPMQLHQDWSFTDEELHECATVWCPLSDVKKSNGALYAIKGSHRFFKSYRSGSLTTSRISASNGLEKY